MPSFQEGEELLFEEVDLRQDKTTPPGNLTESELISLMEKHGIGTDASIAVHVNNICERNYVKVETGRRIAPTELGITLIKGYQNIDEELCQPQVRKRVTRNECLAPGEGLCRETDRSSSERKSGEISNCAKCLESIFTEIQILCTSHLPNGCPL